MGEIIRRLIRWIIFIIIVVLLILLIIKLVKKNDTSKKTKEVINSGVKTIKKNTDKLTPTKKTEEKTSVNEEIVPTTSTLEVTAPDTGSDSYLYILGIAIVGSGICFIYRNREICN